MKIDLTDQVALVTGSARRVGKAIALELARNGVNIMVHYRNSPPGVVRDTMHEIKSFGVDAFEVKADLSRPEEIHKIVDAIESNFGKLHILVNSASIFQKRSLMEVTLEDWEITMAINLRAPFLLTQALAPLMQKNSAGGVIINICDRGVDGPWNEYAHHGISKAGLWALTQVTASSLGPDLRASAIVPGAVMQPAEVHLTDAEWAKIGANTPLQKTGNAADVGRAVVYLASESFLTGTLLHANAGEHLST